VVVGLDGGEGEKLGPVRVADHVCAVGLWLGRKPWGWDRRATGRLPQRVSPLLSPLWGARRLARAGGPGTDRGIR